MLENRVVALFIDFDNIRYGYLNTYSCEPEPLELMGKVRDLGRVVTATAYADFTEHPSHFRRTLEVAGITPRDIPKRNTGSPKSSASMVMLMDIVDCLLDRPDVDTYVLMTGNSDFIRVVTRARHRFGKTVLISGVQGTVSQDLVQSADDHLPLVTDRTPSGSRYLDHRVEQAPPPDGFTREQVDLASLIHHLGSNRPYLTFNFIHSYAINPTGRCRFDEAQASSLLDNFVEDGVLIPFEKRLDDGRTVVNVRLNYDHPLSQYVSRSRNSES